MMCRGNGAPAERTTERRMTMLRMLLTTLTGSKPETQPAPAADLRTRCGWDVRYGEARKRRIIAEALREREREQRKAVSDVEMFLAERFGVDSVAQTVNRGTVNG